MNAIISGRSGRALIIDGNALASFDVDVPSIIVSRKSTDLPYLFGDATDLRFIELTTTESVLRELNADCDFTLALDLALVLLDADLPEDIRTEAAEGLEELLGDTRTVEQLENVLYSKPFPEDADLKRALELCDVSGTSSVVQTFQRCQQLQSSIAAVDRAWDGIPSSVFKDHESREVFRRVAVREGLFRTLAKLDSSVSVSTFLLKAGLNNSIRQLPNYRRVLQEWSVPFRESRETMRVEIEQDDEDLSAEEVRFERRERLDRRVVLKETLRRKSVIIDVMRRRDVSRVYELVDELVSFQQSNSESQHTAKSLCDLAMEAKTLGISSLQLALTERSIRIAPGDGWSWAQYADALLKSERFQEALNAYHQARAFGAGVVAKTGGAEVLKAQGQFADALATYDEVIGQHPDDVVAKNGRAEVLKALGQFADALAAYDEVIGQHPENVVAKTGRAEVLKALGQFADALAAYDEVIGQHPENVVAKTGRAEILKAQGQFADALAAYDDVIGQHPDDVVAKNGRAEVLKALGQLANALAAYDEVIGQHPENVVAKTGRAEVLKALGQFADALAAYDDVIGQHPENVVAKNGRAEVLKALGQFADALAAYDEVISQHPENVVAKNGRAEVLKALGQFADALAAYDEVIGQHPENVVAKTGRAEVLKAQGQFADALAAYNEVISLYPDDAVARNGRSSVLVGLGLFHQALESLPETAPQGHQRWISYHIKGMIFLQLGRMSEALKVFSNGVQDCPFPLQTEYFRSALALSWIRKRDFKKATDTLDEITSPTFQPTANVIRIHAFGAQGERLRARQAYEELASTPYLLRDELTQELHHRYVLGETATKDEEWVFDREVRLFVKAA